MFFTENCNSIFRLFFADGIADPTEWTLVSTASFGVVETGLFLNMQKGLLLVVQRA